MLVIFHPGDFSDGDKADVTVWPELLDAGIAVVRVNTRLSGMMAQALAPTGALMAFISLWTGALWGKPMWGACGSGMPA